MEKFAAYGFQLETPADWRIEFNSKNSRERGDVAFHSPKNNVFFVSWGRLEDAQKKYRSLEEHRDQTVGRIRKDPNILKADMVTSTRKSVSAHEAILTKVTAQRRGTMLARQQSLHDIWSVHFYCPQTKRYYVVYWHVKDREEYPEAEAKFASLVGSVVCHP